MKLNTGDLVTCRIIRINRNDVRCQLLLHHPTIKNTTYNVQKYNVSGIIRYNDCQANITSDLIPIHELYHPNDIIVSTIQYYNPSSSQYILSTQSIEHGVIICYCECGSTLVPINNNTVQCPVTKHEYKRKLGNIEKYIQLTNTNT